MNKALLSRVLALWALVLLASLSVASAPEKGEPLPRKGALGVQLSVPTPEEAKQAGLSEGGGRKVMSVAPGLTAEAIGLKVGDIVLSINGQKLAAPADLATAVRGLVGGKKVEVQVFRDGKTQTLTGTTKERPRQVEEGMEVVYDQVVSKGKRIRVIATHPKGKGPFPTLFLIGGIGAYSVDSPFATMPYGNILGPLAQQGYATVRMDKPGQGDSEGPIYTELRFEDELDAYIQTLKLAKTYSFVDTKKLVIFGHSMGGFFGPLVNKAEPVSGMIIGATASKTWIEYQIENTRRQILLGGTPASEVDRFMPDYVAAMHYIFNEGWSIEKTRKEVPRLASFLNEVSPDGKTMSGVGIPFFQYIAKTNIIEGWNSVEGKTLLFYGENDFVTCKEDHEYLETILNKRKPGLAKFVLLPNSDHGFFQTTSPADSLSKWGQPGNKFNDNILTEMKKWLAENFPLK